MAEYGWEEEGNYGCFEAEPLSSYGDDIEVIGNIHDNQELLEEDIIPNACRPLRRVKENYAECD